MKKSCNTCKKLHTLFCCNRSGVEGCFGNSDKGGLSSDPIFIKILSDENFFTHLEFSNEDLSCLENLKLIYLIGPISNTLHKTEVNPGENSFLLQQGWKEFVEENSLQRNDVLIFSYDQYSIFKVTIFDKNGRKIREKRSVERMNGEREEERAELNDGYFGNIGDLGGRNSKIGKVKVLDVGCSSKPPKRGQVEVNQNKRAHENISSVGNATRGNDAMSKRGKQIAEESSERDDSNSLNESTEPEESDSLIVIQREQDPPEIIPLNSDSSQDKKMKSEGLSSKSKLPVIKREVDESEDLDSEIGGKKERKTKLRSLRIFESNRRSVTIKEIAKTKRQAEKLKCNNAYFMKVMETNNVYMRFYLHLPKEFASTNFPKTSRYVLLRLPGSERKWKVHCNYTLIIKSHQHLWRFSSGWKNFSFQNNLEEGDVCVFELTNKVKKDIELTVHIFRIVQEVVKLSSGHIRA